MNSFNVLLIGLDIVLIGLAGYYLFWQSKIQFTSRYAVSQLIWAVLLGFWFMTTRVNNMPYIIFISIFLVLSIMAGTGGYSPDRQRFTGARDSIHAHVQYHLDTGKPSKWPGMGCCRICP